MASPLAPLTGPYGTFQIPRSIAPIYGMPEQDPLGPLPTFQPGELEGVILGDVPRVTEPPAPLPVAPAPAAPVDLPPSVTRGPIAGPTPQPLVMPDEQVAAPAPPQPQAPPPAAGSVESMYANLDERKDIARRQGELEAQTGREEAALYDKANADDELLAKARQVEREQVNKELASARAKQASALDAYVNHKVDQNRLWHNMGTGSKIFAGIGIALSGVGNALAKKGDARNPALDMIMGAIQDDVRLQLAERDKLGQVAAMRKDAVNDLRTQYQDGEAAYGALVAGNTARVQNMLKGVAARAKDPAAKLRAEGLINELGAEKDKIALDSQAREAAARQQALENRQRQSQLGLAWAGHKRGILESDRDFDEKQRQFDITTGLRAQEQQAAVDVTAKKLEAEGKDKEAKEIRELSIGGFNRAPLKQADGTVYKAPDPMRSKELQKQAAAGAEAIRIIDQIKKLRSDHGSEWFKTDAARQLKGNMSALQLQIKNVAELGVLAGPDMELINNFLGTGNAAEMDAFGSIEKGLDEARNNIRSAVQRSLETANFTGEWRPPDLSKRDDTKSDADIAAKMAKDEKTTSEVEKSGRSWSVSRKLLLPLGGETPKDRAAGEEATARSDDELPGVTKEAATGLRALGALATGADEYQAKRARQNLTELATKGPTEKRLAAIEVMRSAGLTAEADAAVEKLPAGESGVRGVREFVKAQQAAPANDNVDSLESAARSGDGAARFRLVQMAGMPGPGQKEAGAALIRLTRGGAR